MEQLSSLKPSPTKNLLIFSSFPNSTTPTAIFSSADLLSTNLGAFGPQQHQLPKQVSLKNVKRVLPQLLSNQNQYQQPNQQQNANMSLLSITCGTSASACFKFVCAGTGEHVINSQITRNFLANYTIKGCQDPAQSQFSCQTLQNQCPGGQGKQLANIHVKYTYFFRNLLHVHGK